jgi:hypothetical protein
MRDPTEEWAPLALAQVIRAQPPRTELRPMHEAFADAPAELRAVIEAAAAHECGIYLGNYQLRALDGWTIVSPADLGVERYEGLSKWGGYAGRRVREQKQWCMPLATGAWEAVLAWSPGDATAAVAELTEPLAGVPESEHEHVLQSSIGGWLLEMMGFNPWEMEPAGRGAMHPTYVKRGRHNSLEDVWKLLHDANERGSWDEQ